MLGQDLSPQMLPKMGCILTPTRQCMADAQTVHVGPSTQVTDLPARQTRWDEKAGLLFFVPQARRTLGAYRIPRRPAFSSHLVNAVTVEVGTGTATSG
jgi:hypothetical protein